jgi:hypothetical protein
VTSRTKSERRLPERGNIPPLLAAFFELKSAHWRYGVYLIFHFVKLDDGSGEEPVLAINLTRPQSGSREEPIPDEVLREISEAEGIALFDSSGSAESRAPIRIRHHNGGPVHWSSIRTATYVVNISREIVSALYFSLSSEPHLPPPLWFPLYETTNPAAEPSAQFTIWSLSPSSSLLIGRFAEVLSFVRHLSQTPLPHLNHRSPSACGAQFLVNSYSGYAQWSRAQLVQELSDLHGWGVVVPDDTLRVCGEYLESAQPPAPPQSEEKESASAVTPPPAPPFSFGARGGEAGEEKLRLWKAVSELCLPRRRAMSLG